MFGTNVATSNSNTANTQQQANMQRPSPVQPSGNNNQQGNNNSNFTDIWNISTGTGTSTRPNTGSNQPVNPLSQQNNLNPATNSPTDQSQPRPAPRTATFNQLFGMGK